MNSPVHHLQKWQPLEIQNLETPFLNYPPPLISTLIWVFHWGSSDWLGSMFCPSSFEYLRPGCLVSTSSTSVTSPKKENPVDKILLPIIEKWRIQKLKFKLWLYNILFLFHYTKVRPFWSFYNKTVNYWTSQQVTELTINNRSFVRWCHFTSTTRMSYCIWYPYPPPLPLPPRPVEQPWNSPGGILWGWTFNFHEILQG